MAVVVSLIAITASPINPVDSHQGVDAAPLLVSFVCFGKETVWCAFCFNHHRNDSESTFVKPYILYMDLVIYVCLEYKNRD